MRSSFFLFFSALLSVGSIIAGPNVSNTSGAMSARQLEGLTPEQRIDYLVESKLKEQKIEPNAAVDDAAFVRRAYLDIIGRIPTIEEAESFHAENYDNKRERLIEQLLSGEGYVAHNYNFWADVLRVNRNLTNSGAQAEAAYQLWIKQALRENMPYDKFVYELVRGRGHIWENGAAGYYQRDRGMPLDNMSNTVRIFLGTRLECAQCHNHPFDKWTQMDYYKMAAFSYGMSANGYGVENRSAMSSYIREKRNETFRKAVAKHVNSEWAPKFPVFYRERDVDRYVKGKNYQKYLDRYEMTDKQFKKAAKIGMKATESVEKEYQAIRDAERLLYQRVRYTTTSVKDNAVLKLPHDYQYTDAKPHDVVSADTMFGYDIDIENVSGETIDAYAEWLTAEDNPTFTKVIANRLWKKVFGLGVFEPVDELTDLTKVSNEPLMEYLEQLMRELDYDIRGYLKILYNTKAYQRTANNEEIVMGAPYYFQGPILRRMTAEQMWDSIVGLALPEADSYSPRLKTQLSSIEKLRLMYSSLADISPEEYLAMTQEIGEAVSTINPKIDEVRKELYKAREEENNELYKEKRSELSILSRELNKIVSDIGFKKLHQAVDGENLLAALGMSEMTMSSMGGEMSMAEGAAGGGAAVLTKLPKPTFPKPPADLPRDMQKKWVAAKKADYSMYTKLVANMARASELTSPAPRGHFLREFGQSDREVIENSSQYASVPQALNLLNGNIVEALTNEFAVFGNRVHAEGNSEDKIRMIFQAMLTRQPTDSEMSLAMAEVEANGDSAYEALVWALLNTQQFMFVQ
tara:strand:+ start:7594 stop:10002 length:2409 start_codon:yes stop_codon:yes gene_type:complete